MNTNINHESGDEPRTIVTIGKELFTFWPDVSFLTRKVVDLDKAKRLEILNEQEMQEELWPLMESLVAKFDQVELWLDGQIIYLESSEAFVGSSYIERERKAVAFFALLEAQRSFVQSIASDLEHEPEFMGASAYVSTLTRAVQLVEQQLETMRANAPEDNAGTFFADFNAYSERLEKSVERVQATLALPENLVDLSLRGALTEIGEDLSDTAQFLYAQMRIIRDPSCIEGATLAERASRAQNHLSCFENVRKIANVLQAFFEDTENASSDCVRALSTAIEYLHSHVTRFTTPTPLTQKPPTGQTTDDRVKDFLRKRPQFGE